MAKRKASQIVEATNGTSAPPPAPLTSSSSKNTPVPLPVPRRRPAPNGAPPAAPQRRASARVLARESTNPDVNPEILDGDDAVRASPDGSDIEDDITARVNGARESESPLSDAPAESQPSQPPAKKPRTPAKKAAAKVNDETQPGDAPVNSASKTGKASVDGVPGDPEADVEEEADEEEIKQALARPPPVNSDYLPLPWKGRLGYACLNTYLRYSNPPVFSSRTCRIASILEHRHPLKDPSQPEHATKNRPDKDQPADIRRGMEYVENIGLANARDVIKMLRWNDKYGIKFLRLSSEMFPFASHEEYGYKLAPFAADTLAEVGKVVAELGHRVTTHPGQFTQLGSPRKPVIENAIRDLEYHDEMLSLLKLPEQMNKDAVMILHMGGVFGDKEATLDRFRENYARLSQSIKNRLVLENDDMSWSVHDLLPVCEELNIPMVLDFHHHNIIFDADKIREGTKDISDLFPRILATWQRKGIRPKMHYSEPTPAAITGTQRRKHSPRVATLPPCPPDMDLMIEAKDKEQAVFELMRNFKLPGYDTFNDIIPHVRNDDNKPVRAPAKKKPKRKTKKQKEEEMLEEAAEEVEDTGPKIVPDEEVGMGGPEGRVYWPPGMEEWLRPVKRVVKKKDPDAETPAKGKKRKAAAPAAATNGDDESEIKTEDIDGATDVSAASVATPAKKARPTPSRKNTGSAKKGKAVKAEPTPETSEAEDDEMDLDEEPVKPVTKARPAGARSSGRARGKAVNYVVDADSAGELE